MEFQVKNANGDVLRLFAVPGETVLKFEVIPAPIPQPFEGGPRPAEESVYSDVPSADGPPLEVTEKGRA